MKYLSLICLLLASIIGQAQKNTIKRIPLDPNNLPIVCKGQQGNHGHVILPKAKSRNKLNNPAVFEVEFDRNMPPAAIAAFDYAAQQLSEVLSSTIPIRVAITWEELEGFSLAAAGPSEFVKDFPNGPKGIAFPIALAEKIAQQAINQGNEPDIYVSINNRIDWFYDYENPTSIQSTEFDYVSIVLHELLHGIGFTGFSTTEFGQGTIKNNKIPANCTEDACSGPSIYDVYLSNLFTGNLCEHLPDPSEALGTALTDSELHLSTPSFGTTTALPQLYAPRPFESGSSVYHLDQDTYENTPNSLMAPFIGTGEIEHGLGIALNVLYDLGWGPETPNYSDILSPFIEHTPIISIDDKTTALPVEAIAEDVFSDIEKIYVEYSINGIQQATITLNSVVGDLFRKDLYTGDIELTSSLVATDKLEYRIVAVDDSEQANIRTSPSEGYYVVNIEKTATLTITYINDFNLSSNDFSGNSFNIATPIEFGDAAIQSLHPYPSGTEGNISNLNYQLLRPIQIRAEDPLIKFEEIVLVEPGEPNTVYTELEFWDYVIVEARKIDGKEWLPIIDGYDSRTFDAWHTAYLDGTRRNNQNSRTEGRPDLFQSRVIDMTESGHFKTGDVVFIRFRLFSDSSFTGWGWAIDNLRIQDSSVAVEDFITTNDFQVFPNPVSKDVVTINASFKQATKEVQLLLYDGFGRLVEQRSLSPTKDRLQEVVDIGQYASGLYWVALQINGKELIGKKLIVE